MIGKLMGIVGLAATVVAAALVLAAPAGAGRDAAVHLVSGSDAFGLVSGSLEGQITDTPDTFSSFLATRKLTPGGVLTWRAPVVFEGCVDGIHCGKLSLDGHYFYRFEPGTTYYDFELGGYQPGTVGDPAAWISGQSILRITGGGCNAAGQCDLDGASGMLAFTETVFLSEHVYRGIVRV